MADEPKYRIWMRPLRPNVADPRWYPPHVPTKDEGSKAWAEVTARRLNASDGSGPFPAWHFEAMPATETPPACALPTPSGECGLPLGHPERCA